MRWLLQQWGRLQLSAEGSNRGTGGGMECLAGDAVRGLLWLADASPIGSQALGLANRALFWVVARFPG